MQKIGFWYIICLQILKNDLRSFLFCQFMRDAFFFGQSQVEPR